MKKIPIDAAAFETWKHVEHITLAGIVNEQAKRIAQLEAALVDLYDGASTYTRYQHRLYHEGDYESCHRGICPGVRGMLRTHQDLVQTAVKTPVKETDS